MITREWRQWFEQRKFYYQSLMAAELHSPEYIRISIRSMQHLLDEEPH